MTDPSPLPPPNRDPEVARIARAGISVPAILASFLACGAGIFATLAVSELKLNQDLGRLMVDAGGKMVVPFLKTGMIEIGGIAVYIYDQVRLLTASTTLAEILARLTVVAAFLGVAVFGLVAFRLIGHWFGDDGRTPDTADRIVLPRERGGGARLGGGMVFWTTTLLMTFVAGIPDLFDTWVENKHWAFHSVGFVEAGVVVSGFMIASDSNLFDGRLWQMLRAWFLRFVSRWRNDAKPASPPRPAPSLVDYRDAIVAHLGDAVRARPVVVMPASPPTPGGATTLGPASLAHAGTLTGTFDEEAATRWHDAVRAFVGDGKGRNVTLLDPLSKLHFAFLIEAMSIVQDQGRGVLVIVPQTMAYSLLADLEDAYSVHCRDITQSMLVDIGDAGGDAKDEATIETVLFVTDRSLQRRVVEREAKAFSGVVERLGLIVVLDAHLFDLTRLRLQLAILFQRAPATDIRVIAHAAAWRGMEAELDKIFTATRRKTIRLRMSRPDTADLETVVVNNCTRARDALLEGFYPAFSAPAITGSGRPFRSAASRKELEPLPLLARVALRPPFAFNVGDLSLIGAGLMDTARRWEQVGSRLEAADPPTRGERPASALLGDLYDRRTSRPDPDKPARMLLVQDRANLVDVLISLGSAATRDQRLALIAVERYPLRDFMIDHVIDGRFDVAQDHETIPIAPRPADGLRELAQLLLAEMTAGDGIPTAEGPPLRGVTRSRAIELFAALGNRRLAVAHRISPTRLGIKRLLQMEFGGYFEVRAMPLRTAIAPLVRLGDRPPIDDDVVFVCANAEERSADTSSLIPLETGGYNGTDRIGWIARDDHGLSFLRGTTIVTDDVARVVLSVTEERVLLRTTDDPTTGNHGLGSMPRTTFCRHYDLDLTANTVVVASAEAGGRTPDGTTIRHFRLFAPMRRLTHSKIVEESMTVSDGAIADLPERLSIEDRVACARAVSRAVVIRFERPTSPPEDADARIEMETAASRIAFTLQVTLSDILFSLFPLVAHRLAVVAPRAAAAFARLDRDAVAPAAHVAARYPRLAPLDATGRPIDDPEHIERLTVDLGRLLDRSWLGEEPSTGRVDTIEVIVLEDWSGDLGVCEAIASSRGLIQRTWRAYLEWSAAQARRPDLFHRFGSDRLLEEFTYEAARDLLPPTS